MLTKFNFGAIELVRNVAKIILSFSQVIHNSNHVEDSIIFLNFLVNKTKFVDILRGFFDLLELEAQKTLFEAAGNLLSIGKVAQTNPNTPVTNQLKLTIQSTLIEQDILKIIMNNSGDAERSSDAPGKRWTSTQKICKDIIKSLEKSDPQVLKYYVSLR